MGKIYTFNNKIITINNKWCEEYVEPPVDPWNPLNLPANTIRVKFTSRYTPTMGNTQTLVDSTNNIWDIYKSSNNWYSLFSSNDSLLEILGANTTNVTSIEETFVYCTSLTSIPLFDTSNITNTTCAFYGCTGVETGALALYQQLSTQANPPTKHEATFTNCGALTVTGKAELAQIPEDWKEE